MICKSNYLLIRLENTNLGVPQSILGVVNIQRTQEFLSSLFVVNELSLRNGIRV